MTEAIKGVIEMSRAILADPTEPGWRHEQAQKNLDHYGYQIAAIEMANAIRGNLLMAARVARSMGLDVKASRARDGKVSSYYAGSTTRKVRISDHVLPATAKREAQADFHGGRSAYAAEIIIDDTTTREELIAQLNAVFGG